MPTGPGSADAPHIFSEEDGPDPYGFKDLPDPNSDCGTDFCLSQWRVDSYKNAYTNSYHSNNMV